MIGAKRARTNFVNRHRKTSEKKTENTYLTQLESDRKTVKNARKKREDKKESTENKGEEGRRKKIEV